MSVARDLWSSRFQWCNRMAWFLLGRDGENSRRAQMVHFLSCETEGKARDK